MSIITPDIQATIVKIRILPRRLNPTGLFFIGLSIFLMVSAFRQLQATLTFADLFYLNATLTAGDSANRNVIDRYASQAEAIVTSNQCRSDILDEGLAFILMDLDLQDSVAHYEEWATAMERADRYIVHALSCSPGDGDLWARLAMVRQASSENPDQLSAILSQSSLLAPSEMYVLRARFFVWRRASAHTLALSSETVERDIRTLLSQAYWKDIREILANPGANLKAHVLAAATLVPPNRITMLKLHGVDLTAL